MELKRRTILKSILVLPLIKIGFKIKNYFIKKRFRNHIWILKSGD